MTTATDDVNPRFTNVGWRLNAISCLRAKGESGGRLDQERWEKALRAPWRRTWRGRPGRWSKMSIEKNSGRKQEPSICWPTCNSSGVVIKWTCLEMRCVTCWWSRMWWEEMARSSRTTTRDSASMSRLWKQLWKTSQRRNLCHRNSLDGFYSTSAWGWNHLTSQWSRARRRTMVWRRLKALWRSCGVEED